MKTLEFWCSRIDFNAYISRLANSIPLLFFFLKLSFSSNLTGLQSRQVEYISMWKQVQNLAEVRAYFVDHIGAAAIEELFSKSIFFISTGSNDLIDHFAAQGPVSHTKQAAYIEFLVSTYKFQLRVNFLRSFLKFLYFWKAPSRNSITYVTETLRARSQKDRRDLCPTHRMLPLAESVECHGRLSRCPERIVPDVLRGHRNHAKGSELRTPRAQVFTWEFVQHGYWFLSKSWSLR